MCKMCTIRQLTGSTEGDYSQGFDLSEAGSTAGDPFFGAIAGPLISKVGGALISRLSKKKGGPGIGGMTGITQLQAGIGAVRQFARGGGVAGAVGAFKRGMTGKGGAPPPEYSGITGGPVGRRLAGGVTPIAGGFRMRRRRGRGITGSELRGFKRVVGLLRKVGMVPKGMSRARARRRR